MLIFKIITIAIIVTISSLVLKQSRPDIAMLISVAGGILILLMLFNQFSSIFKWINNLATKTGIDNSVFSPIFKIIGIGYLAEFSASVCEDAGNKSMANKVILSAKIIILVLSLPILNSLIDTIVSVLWKK